MANAAQIAINIAGNDNVSAMLDKITGKVKNLSKTGTGGASTGGGGLFGGMGAKLKSFATVAAVVGGATIAVKGYVAELHRLADEYSNLSGRAHDAATSASDLQKLTGALKQANIRGASLESVSNALAMMTKNTGQMGAEGFAEVLKGVAQLGTEQERAAKLSEIFGKQMGLAFAPIVNGGEDAIQELFNVADTVGAVSDYSVGRFADIGTAWEAVREDISASWAECMIGITESLETACGASMEEIIAFAADFVHYFHAGFEAVVKTAIALGNTFFRVFKVVGESIYYVFEGLWDGIKGLFNGESFAENFAASLHSLADTASAEFDSIRASWEAVGNLQTVRAKDEGKTLGETAKKAVAKIGSKAGVELGKSAAKSLKEGVSFADAIEAGTNKARVLLAKLRRETYTPARTGAGSTATGAGSTARSADRTETQTGAVQYLKLILDEARKMNGNLQFATC